MNRSVKRPPLLSLSSGEERERHPDGVRRKEVRGSWVQSAKMLSRNSLPNPFLQRIPKGGEGGNDHADESGL